MTRHDKPDDVEHNAATKAAPMGLAALGRGQIAYAKAVTVDGNELYAIHAADGEPLAMVENRRLAFAVIRQNDLEPASVH